MLGFWKRRRADLTPQHVRVDIHNHLLPGVDDGAANFDDSLLGLQGLADMGYSGAILTPHIYPEVFDNEERDLLAVFSYFRQQVGRQIENFSLHLAAEYWLDERLVRRVNDTPDQLLRFGPAGKHLLIEMSTVMPPPMMDELLDACARRALRPVVAHVERYPYAHKNNAAMLYHWRQRGALLQMNLGTPAGLYGRTMQRVGMTLWRQNLIDLLGTDLHRTGHLEKCRQGWQQLQRSPNAFDTSTQASLA